MQEAQHSYLHEDGHEITALQVLHDKVQVSVVLERIQQLHHPRVVWAVELAAETYDSTHQQAPARHALLGCARPVQAGKVSPWVGTWGAYGHGGRGKSQLNLQTNDRNPHLVFLKHFTLLHNLHGVNLLIVLLAAHAHLAESASPDNRQLNNLSATSSSELRCFGCNTQRRKNRAARSGQVRQEMQLKRNKREQQLAFSKSVRPIFFFLLLPLPTLLLASSSSSLACNCRTRGLQCVAKQMHLFLDVGRQLHRLHSLLQLLTSAGPSKLANQSDAGNRTSTHAGTAGQADPKLRRPHELPAGKWHKWRHLLSASSPPRPFSLPSRKRFIFFTICRAFSLSRRSDMAGRKRAARTKFCVALRKVQLATSWLENQVTTLQNDWTIDTGHADSNEGTANALRSSATAGQPLCACQRTPSQSAELRSQRIPLGVLLS